MTTGNITVAMREALNWHRPLMIFSAANALLAIVAVVGMAVDDRLVAGSPAWFKPFKFAVSFTLYGMTWAWMISLQPKTSHILWWAATFSAAAATIEQAIIVVQVERGTRSHFNVATEFDTTLWQFMGLTIAVLFVGTLVAGVSLAVRRVSDPALTWAIRFGIAISLVGMALGKLMADLPSGIDGVSGAHTVGAPDGTPGMPVTGWSTTHGDLRVPHFVGLHALQLLPLIAVLLAAGSKRIPWLDNATLRVRLVWIAAAGYAAVVVLTTWQAQRGQPLLHRDLTTTTGFVLLTTVCVAAAGTAVRFGHKTRKQVEVE